MANKKIQTHVAMAMYEEEFAPVLEERRIASEKERCYAELENEEREASERMADEVDACWAEESVSDEPVQFADEVVESTLKVEDEVCDEVVEVPEQRNRNYRRKQDARNKNKLRRTAINMMKGFVKRMHEDMNNPGYRKHRDGEKVHNPKPLTMIADNVLTRAAKRKLVDKNPK